MPDWQESCDQCRYGHSWQDASQHSVPAMTAILLLLTLTLVVVGAAIAAMRLVSVDGYRRQSTSPRGTRLP